MSPRYPTPFPPPCANAWGDDRFGLWFEITLQEASSEGAVDITQRFRWIEPGSFWMGSPVDKSERYESERPRHRVTLTEGFWLADTACTQALWLAVMGENPSYFKGDALGDIERPVEQVSWYDAQDFLVKLQTLLPGVQAVLPTEAQWEYACRAGTDTPFSFGHNISTELVNYTGNHSHSGAHEGDDRFHTVPVKSLPPNAWGLYEMHGNVWEWCADGQRLYSAQAVVDPVGPGMEPDRQPQDKTNGEIEEGVPRTLRGGSWNSRARDARSAFRNCSYCGVVSVNFGFRVALRTTGSSPGRGN